MSLWLRKLKKKKALPSKTLSWVQVVLASLYSGAFHPTAEGHAAIADAVVAEARGVLERHGQGPRQNASLRPDASDAPEPTEKAEHN